MIEDIVISDVGKSPEKSLLKTKRIYTPITNYMKNLHDTRVTRKGKLSLVRPNLNL